MKILAIDTLEFGIDVEDYDSSFSDLLKKVDNVKIGAQTDYKKQFIEINGMKFIVNRKGQGFYSYKIECEQFYICFMSHSIQNNSPIFVRFMAEYLWEYGYEKAYRKFMQWFNQLNVKIIGNRISRLDICFDTDEIDFIEKNIKDFVTKASKIARHYVDNDYYTNKRFSGFTFGRGGQISCRIYDKTEEIKRSQKNWFKNIWSAYGSDTGKTVWRVEFQIRRKVLKELNIDKMNDVKKNLESVWGYLTQNWLVMKKRGKDTNISRWKTHPNWILVQKAESNYIPLATLRNVIKKGDVERLMNMCLGTMVSISAINDTNMNETYLDLTRYKKEKYDREDTTFQKEVEKRKKKFI